MKRLIIIILIAILLGGCSKKEMNDSIIKDQETKISELNREIKSLEKEKSKLEDLVIKEKEEKGVARYIITINIKQSHFFLDFENNIKDEMNDIEIEIPVDKEFYDSVEEGTVIDDSFRVGSLLLNGTIGNWDVTVADKDIR